MYYLKNKTNQVVKLPDFGIELQANEIRNIYEFTDRVRLQNNASVINDLVYENILIITNADLVEYSKVESVQICSNAYQEVSIIKDSSSNNSKYYYVKDEFRLSKSNTTVIKSFKGSVETLHIIASNPVDIVITTGDGIKLPKDMLIKRQTLEFDFNSKVRDINIQITLQSGIADVEIFIDGTCEESVDIIQSFIDNWRE